MIRGAAPGLGSDSRRVPGAPRDVLELLRSGDQEAWLGRVSAAPDVAIGSVRLLAPIPHPPGDVIALGLNYVEHVSETSKDTQQVDLPSRPVLFGKAAGSVSGPFDDIRVDPSATKQVDWEVELALVIGVQGRDIAPEAAYGHVFGYTVANDYAIRDYLENYYRPNLRVKSRDGCTPLGPWLVDAADVADPMNLALRTYVNGELAQEGNTRDMIFGIPFLIEYFSSFMTLQPGDLILTGTPDGVVDCRPGDVVVTEIEGIGALMNTIQT